MIKFGLVVIVTILFIVVIRLVVFTVPWIEDNPTPSPTTSISLTSKDRSQDVQPIQGVVPFDICDSKNPCMNISDPNVAQALGPNDVVQVSGYQLQRWEEQQHNTLVWAIIATMVAVAFVLNNVIIVLSSYARGRRLKSAAAPKERAGYKLN